jgi:hypothetical protein
MHFGVHKKEARKRKKPFASITAGKKTFSPPYKRYKKRRMNKNKKTITSRSFYLNS